MGSEQKKLIKLLEERIEKHDNSRKAAQDKLHEICEEFSEPIDDLEERINKELEEKYASENNRLQTALKELREDNSPSALQKAKKDLLVIQSYEIIDNNEEEEEDDEDELNSDDDDDDDGSDDESDEDEIRESETKKSKLDITNQYELKAERRIDTNLVEMKKPTNVNIISTKGGSITVELTCLNPDEERILTDPTIANPVEYECSLFKKDNEEESEQYLLDKNKDGSSSFTLVPDLIEAGTTYGLKVRMVIEDKESEWSDDVAEFTTPEFNECCVWKECPSDVGREWRYNLDEKNLRIASKASGDDEYCTIVGNTFIPSNAVTSWSVKILKSENNDGSCIYIGVAPFSIDQSLNNYDECGWYFYCYESMLVSGPPYDYIDEEYGPRKKDGEYVHNGDSVGVVMDTTKGELSFVVGGVNLGVAYEGIPLDEPLVPCVLLNCKGDSVELIN